MNDNLTYATQAAAAKVLWALLKTETNAAAKADIRKRLLGLRGR